MGEYETLRDDILNWCQYAVNSTLSLPIKIHKEYLIKIFINLLVLKMTELMLNVLLNLKEFMMIV